jgi:predicted Zn-dependent protease with MMP-like domain
LRPNAFRRQPLFFSVRGRRSSGALGGPENLPYNKIMAESSNLPAAALAWPSAKAPSLDELEVLAEEAYRRLPEHFRKLCEGLIIQVDDYATDEVLDSMGIKSELDLLGLFQGVGLPFRSDAVPGQMPNMVWLYRVPILLYWAEHDETLGAVVTHVLVHEIGHHFGLSDDDIDAIEAKAG